MNTHFYLLFGREKKYQLKLSETFTYQNNPLNIIALQ